MKTFISAKLHNLRVTGKAVEYTGSVTVCRELLRAAGITPYEQAHIVNLTNGRRWITYVIPGEPGVFELNGGGARLGEKGDLCVVMTYTQAREFEGATVLFVGQQNQVVDQQQYENS